MNNVLDMLAKAGFEASTIGNDVLPCTLQKDGEPVGFLLGDMSVKLVPDHETDRKELESIISFAVENQGLDMVQNEFKLSQYRDILLTAAYDFDSNRPVYNIYSEDKDKNLLLLYSAEEKSAATRDFASRSGLVPGDVPGPEKESNRVGKFVEAIKSQGFNLSESRGEAHRAFDITDPGGKIVGYIGKDNRVNITSDSAQVKRTLTNDYISTNPDQLMLPSFFEKLKERLKEIGLALKVIFTGKGRHYAIHNENHQEIATVSDQHQVTYTNLATDVQKARIDALVDEIRRENQERQNPEEEKSTESVDAHPEVAASAPVFTTVKMQNLAEAVLSDTALTTSLFSAILSSPALLSRLNGDLAQKLQMLRPDVGQAAFSEDSRFTLNGFEADDDAFYANITYAGKEYHQIVREQGGQFYIMTGTRERIRHNFTPEQTNQYLAFEKSHLQPAVQEENRQLSAGEIKISQDFGKYLDYLQTLDGFNEEKQQSVIAEMVARFGTADPNEFHVLLQEGKFSQESKLSERVKASQKVADLQNAKGTPEQVKEQQKERA